MPTTVFPSGALGSSAGTIDDAAAALAAAALKAQAIVQRKSVVSNGAAGYTEAWADLGALAFSLKSTTKFTESVQGDEVKATTSWYALFRLRSDVLPQDRIKLGGLFRISLGLATSGTFTLSFNGQTTGAIAWNATASTVRAALAALSSVGSADNVDVSGQAGGPLNITLIGDLLGSALPVTGDGAGLTLDDGEFEISQQVFEVVDTDAGLTNALFLTAMLLRVDR